MVQTGQVPALSAVDATTWRQDRRLSTFSTLATESPAEVAANLPADIRAALPAIIAFEAARCAPATNEQVIAALTQTMALIGGVMDQKDRLLWQVAAAEELKAIPADLAIEGLKRARQTCRRPSDIVAAVFEYVGDLGRRRRARVDSLIILARVASVPFLIGKEG